VHLEGTVRAGDAAADRPPATGWALPADTADGLAGLYEFRDFDHFIETWVTTTGRAADRAGFPAGGWSSTRPRAASHGAVYLEGIFTPAEAVNRGASWDQVFTGYCDGAQQARELHGVQVRLTPDIPRGYPLEAARG